jgi:hypothetical protein
LPVSVGKRLMSFLCLYYPRQKCVKDDVVFLFRQSHIFLLLYVVPGLMHTYVDSDRPYNAASTTANNGADYVTNRSTHFCAVRATDKAAGDCAQQETDDRTVSSTDNSTYACSVKTSDNRAVSATD